ncbi:MAG: hypothetical protein HUN04_08740 [Desulfobacter sp.]|nr:MAG: hypothetical protein HUN04_08740 [Desulfobacter sp.]
MYCNGEGQMIFGIRIAPVEFSLLKSEKALISLPGVKHGQVIKADVMELLPQGRVKLMIAGRMVTAKTDLPVAPGSDLFLEVSREKETISLKPVTARPAEPLTSASRGGTPRSALSAAQLFSRINDRFPEIGRTKEPAVKQILHSLALKSGERDEGFLPRLLENMGLALEKKISKLAASPDKQAVKIGMDNLVKEDLKAAVLHFHSGEEDGAGKQVKEKAAPFDHLQQFNLRTGETGRYLLPFPVPAGEFFDFGQLFINTGEGGKKDTAGDNKTVKIAFLMNLTALGRLRADFSILKKEIAGRFILEDEATCGYISRLIPELKSRLSSIGYRAGRVECRVADPRELAPDALVRSVTLRDNGDGLNLVV